MMRGLIGACVMAIALIPAGSPTAHVEHADDRNWIIAKDTTWQNEFVSVTGNLTITSGARLTMDGSHLEIGGRLHVQPNATLHLISSMRHPSKITAAKGDGFWMHIEGYFLSEGVGSEILGLWGDGLISTLPNNMGGMWIPGHADLEGIRIHDGTAGVFVTEGGTLEMRRSAVERLNGAGILALGSIRLNAVNLVDNDINILGKDTCDIHIHQSTFRGALAEHALINNCVAEIHDSLLEGSEVAVVANNAAIVTVKNTTIRDYGIDGLGSYASPSEGGMLRPTVRFHDVMLEPAGRAKRGADVSGAGLIEFVNVTVAGHASSGIQAQNSVLSIQGSNFTSNGGYGVLLVGGSFRGDPLAAGNQFGIGSRSSNTAGAISHILIVQFEVFDEDGERVQLDGDLNVTLTSGLQASPIKILSNRSLLGGGIELVFRVYNTTVGGTPLYMGPFIYQATHPVRGEPWTGTIEPDQTQIRLVVASTEPAAEKESKGWPPVFVGLAIGGVMLARLAAGRRSH